MTIEQIFNKPYSEININDLKHFFSSKQEETSVFEFKMADVSLESIYKEIAAFLNTDGGIIFIGTPIEQKDKIGKSIITFCQGELTYSKVLRDKDWLIQKIYSNITPPPTNIRIKDFVTDDGNAFIIEVPQSTTPPHQVNDDGKYYIRLEREAKAAPHGLVQALFDKRKKPQLDAEIKISPVTKLNNILEIKISFVNKSNTPANNSSFIIDVYNVDKVYSKEIDFSPLMDRVLKYTGTTDSKRVLVSLVKIPITLTIDHSKQQLVLFTGYWCSEQDFNFRYWHIDPNLATIISSHSKDESSANFTELLDLLKKS